MSGTALMAGLTGLAAASLAGSWSVSMADTETTDAEVFVETFWTLAVPRRLSYDGTRAWLAEQGWRDVTDDPPPDLARLLAKVREMVETDARDHTDFKLTAFAGDAEGRPMFFIVTRVHKPEVITLVGSGLYDFNATGIIDPFLVVDKLGVPMARSLELDGLVGHVWGPSPDLPRTLDTYLTFVAPGSAAAEQTGFSGLMLKFATSEPGEDG